MVETAVLYLTQYKSQGYQDWWTCGKAQFVKWVGLLLRQVQWDECAPHVKWVGLLLRQECGVGSSVKWEVQHPPTVLDSPRYNTKYIQ